MPNCKPQEELYNGRCRVKCKPNQVRNPNTRRCIDKTRFDTQTAKLAEAERQRIFALNRAESVGIKKGIKKGIAEGEEERRELLNAIGRRDLRIINLRSEIDEKEQRLVSLDERISIVEKEKKDLDRKHENLNASIGRRGLDIDKLNKEISQKNIELQGLKKERVNLNLRVNDLNASIKRRNQKIENLNQQSNARLEKINSLDRELVIKRDIINALRDEVSGNNVTIQDLRNQRLEVRRYNSVLIEQADKLKEDLRKSKSDRVNLFVQNRMHEDEIKALVTQIGIQMEEKEQMIIDNAIAQNLNDEQQNELRDRLAIVIQEREAIEHSFVQTSIVLNTEIDRLHEIVEEKDDQLAELLLERVLKEEQVLNLDSELNEKRTEQLILLERQVVNNETLVNAQNKLADSEGRNSELTRKLEMLSVRSITENANLQDQINVLSQANRNIISERDQLSREIQEKNTQVRRLRSEREIQDNDSRNTQDGMNEIISELTNERDMLVSTITGLVSSFNETTNRLNFATEENIVMSAQLRASENTILDFRRRLFTDTE